MSCKLDFNSRMRRRSLVASLPASKRWLCNKSRARTLSPTLSLWLHFAKGTQLISSLECVVRVRPVGPHRILCSAYHVRCVSLKLLRQKPSKLVNKRTTARNLTGWSTKGIKHLEFRDPCIFSWLSLAQDSGTDLLQRSSCTIYVLSRGKKILFFIFYNLHENQCCTAVSSVKWINCLILMIAPEFYCGSPFLGNGHSFLCKV